MDVWELDAEEVESLLQRIRPGAHGFVVLLLDLLAGIHGHGDAVFFCLPAESVPREVAAFFEGVARDAHAARAVDGDGAAAGAQDGVVLDAHVFDPVGAGQLALDAQLDGGAVFVRNGAQVGVTDRHLLFAPRHEFFSLDAGALRENCFCPIPSVAYSEIRPLCATLALVSGKNG